MILSRPDAIEWRHAQTRKPVVLASGCFDVLHVGHLKLFHVASTYGKLIVGINSDESIRKLKGPGRPINNLTDRMYFLDDLKSVEVVVPFAEDTVENLIAELAPDYWVKGSDYTRATLNQAEVKAAEKVGATIIFVDLIKGFSTSEMLIKMLRT